MLSSLRDPEVGPLHPARPLPFRLYALDGRAPRMRSDVVVHGPWGTHLVKGVQVDPGMPTHEFTVSSRAR